MRVPEIMIDIQEFFAHLLWVENAQEQCVGVESGHKLIDLTTHGETRLYVCESCGDDCNKSKTLLFGFF